eukprot:5540166-Lingulodinium_polyedra.AAC.1
MAGEAKARWSLVRETAENLAPIVEAARLVGGGLRDWCLENWMFSLCLLFLLWAYLGAERVAP